MQIYDKITARIVEALEKGTVPWRKTWSTVGGLPRNLISKKEYRGVNAFMLALTEFEQPLWITYREAKLFGGHVREGEKGMPVIYWNWIDKTDESTGEAERVPFLKNYTVFNVAQCELPAKILPVLTGQHVRDFTPIEECERILASMPQRPAIHEGAGAAFYRPSTDSVHLPARIRFESDPAFYAVAFHELAHSTGHKSRLNREGVVDVAPFGSPTYSREELVAEMSAAFLCGHCGIDCSTLENSAAYVAGWLSVLKADSKAVILAAAQAQKATDFILGTKFEDR